MEKNLNDFMEKAKASAELFASRTGAAAAYAADTATRRASGVMGAARLNLQVFDLNAEIETLYKELGKMVYDVHCGAEGDPEEMKKKLDGIDERRARIGELRAQLGELRETTPCPNCGRDCSRGARFCDNCGAQL